MYPVAVYGRGNLIPVGHTKFYEDFVEHDPADPFVPSPMPTPVDTTNAPKDFTADGHPRLDSRQRERPRRQSPPN